MSNLRQIEVFLLGVSLRTNGDVAFIVHDKDGQLHLPSCTLIEDERLIEAAERLLVCLVGRKKIWESPQQEVCIDTDDSDIIVVPFTCSVWESMPFVAKDAKWMTAVEVQVANGRFYPNHFAILTEIFNKTNIACI